jgi:hypothetical protein
MKTVIDCDAVFEILTQAPFPTGDPADRDVESHLRVCHECRGLAEALRPAVGLLHESLADESRLPRYDGELVRQGVHGQCDSRRIKHRAALIAAGLAACLLTWLSYYGAQRNQSSGGESRRFALAIPDADGLSTLRSLSLSAACVSQRDRRVPWDNTVVDWIDAGELALSCCTECHRAGGPGPASARAMRALDVACAACHRPATTTG